MTNSEETLVNEQSQPSFHQKLVRGIKISVVVVGIALWGFGIYKGFEQIHRGQAIYDRYENSFQIHVERAANAGTIALATEEIAQAIPWLENNYAKDTYEYRNLKANLQYLQKQDPTQLVTDNVKNSIDQTSKIIEERQKTNLDNSNSLLFFIIVMSFLTYLLLMGLYFLEFGRFYL